MKNLAITFSIIFAFQLGSLFGQTVDPIIGEWVNSYNSVLTISSHSPETSFFEGTYSSSTGATGKYAVSGYSPYTLTAEKGIPVSFTINWKTLPNSNNKETPDQEWTSTMAGSLIINKEGEAIIQVFHSLNASLPLGAVQIDTHGRYSETLIFKQKSTKSLLKEDVAVVHKSDKHYTDNSNPLLGIWSGAKSEYMLEITKITDQSGLVDGFYQNASGRVPVKGYTAVSPSGNYQSVSLSFMSLDKKYCFAMGGFLNNDRNLELMVYKAKAVVIANNYSSVNVYKNNFIKSSFYSKSNKAKRSDDKIVIAMSKNPFTNNGASEWTGLIPIGTPKQGDIPILKFGMDTGGYFNWVNSVQCTVNSCVNYNHIQFDQNNSSSFSFIDSIPRTVDWGPWGEAEANLGRDILHLETSSFLADVAVSMKLITNFADTPQFQEFLWDGAIGFPADSRQTAERVSNLLQVLVNARILPISSEGKVCVSFYHINKYDMGYLVMGANCDSPILNIDTSSKLVFKQEPYKSIPFLWASKLNSFKIGNKQFASDATFSFDTGSSALKGDKKTLTNALKYVNYIHEETGNWPNIVYDMGTDNFGQTGKLIITSEEYVKLIEQGQDAGTYQPQIQTLDGTPNLYLQGTTLLSSVYSVFWYNAVQSSPGNYDLIGDEVWLYNYTNGPKIIQKNVAIDKNQFKIFKQKTLFDNNVKIFPNPSYDGMFDISINLSKDSNIKVKIFDLNGVMLNEKDFGNIQPGFQTLKFDIRENHSDKLKKGLYHIIKVFQENKVLMTKKIVIN